MSRLEFKFIDDFRTSYIIGHFDESLHPIIKNGDPRINDWTYTTNPIYTIALVIGYFITIGLIQRYMKNRKPYELRGFLLFYNLCQVILSFYMFVEILQVSIQSKYSLVCEPINYSNDPLALRMLNVLWLYYFSKLVDFIDTFVFAFRKKDNQISFLHLFHHSTMFPFSWVTVKYFGGGQIFLGCMLNSLVHTLMYGYYGLSGLGPGVQKYLWWKKYITIIQLVQFFSVVIHLTMSIMNKQCKFPKLFALCTITYVCLLACMFVHFYFKAYVKKQTKTKKAE